MNRMLLILVFGIFILIGGVAFYDQLNESKSIAPVRVLVEGKTYVLEVADTEKERSLGLGERDALCENCAMLFVFPISSKYAFWMKGMRFPIDIVWLQDERVVSVKKSIPFDTKEVFAPDEAANRVLEFNAGEIQGLQKGDRVEFQY